MNKKYNYEIVEKFFSDNGCILVSQSYNNTKEILEYICSCGNPSKIRFGSFKIGQRCVQCGIIKGSQNHKHKLQEVKIIFENQGCILLSEHFQDARTPLDYICLCGNPSKITLDSFKRGTRCKDCGIKKQIESQKHDYNYVKQYFIDNGCILLSLEYVNFHSKLEYVCECGEKSEIAFAEFTQGKRCWDCGRKKIADSHRLTYEFVYNFFKENGCLLLSDIYDNAHQQLDYMCECGEKSIIKFDKFRMGQRCEECGNKKISEKLKGVPRFDLRGANNSNYNPFKTDEEREIQRNFPEYRDWRDLVYKRDDYTCQCCGKRGGGKLVAHHLDGYNWCIEKRLDVDNGVTLCEFCHLDFHHEYGWRDNTREQWEEFYSDFVKDNFDIVI